MFSAGQTQNVGTTLEKIVSLACGNEQAVDVRTQCTQNVTDTYTANLERVPENFKQLFEGFAYLAAKTIFIDCVTLPSNPICSNGGVNLWGGTYTFADFLVKLADLFDPPFVCPSRHSSEYWETHQEEYQRFLECQHPTGDAGAETQPQPHPICQEVHDSGYWATHPDEMERYRHCPHEGGTSNGSPPAQTNSDDASLPCCSDLDATTIQMGLVDCTTDCQSDDVNSENNDESAGVSCDTLNDADWNRNAENCMKCGNTVCN